MSEFLGSEENKISVEILVPGDETVSVGRLCQYLNRTSPRAVLRVNRRTSKASVLPSIESVSTSTGDGTTPSERAYLSRARGFLESEASEASESEEFSEREPEGETLGSVDSMRSIDSDSEDDLSFIVESESYVEALGRFVEQNDAQDTKCLRRVSTVKRELDRLGEDTSAFKRVKFE